MTFPQVLSKYGYPVISKETAKVIYYARRGSRWAINRLDGLDKHGIESKFKERFKKYKFLIDAPFETSRNRAKAYRCNDDGGIGTASVVMAEIWVQFFRFQTSHVKAYVILDRTGRFAISENDWNSLCPCLRRNH